MENPELANTSSKLDKKKKSKLYSDKHGGSSDQENFLHVDTNVKPRRSFWKNLFRKQPKKSEVPEMVTDQKAAVITSRLNAIFEEPKTPEEKEHVVEEIEDIKKTLKKISPIPDAPPSVLLSAITPPSSEPASALNDETLIEYLSDVSSSSDVSVSSLHTPIDAADATGVENRDSIDAFITKLPPAESGDPKDPKKAAEPRESSIGRDGYSFEYSETSDLSTTDEDSKDNKVLTFDEKVEQKDADSNIVVRELNPGNDEQEPETQQPEQHEETELEESGADRQEIVTGSGIVLVLPSSKIPLAIPLSYDQQQPIRSSEINRFAENSLTTSGTTQTSKTEVPKQWADSGSVSATGSVDSLLDEAEMWNRKLNELTGTSGNRIGFPATVDGNQSLDELETDGYREYRLDDYFKMIFRQSTDEQLLNYSVAYDPVFANFNVHCRQPTTHFGASESPYSTLTSDKQKVVRKRKMMSLLHDKTKMAEYLKEIEQQEEDIIKKQQIPLTNCSTPLNSPNKQQSSTVTQTYRTISAGSDDEYNKLEENVDNNVLFVLENTKQKLQKYLERNNSPDPKVRSLYPETYLEIFNMAATKSEEQVSTSQELPTVAHKMKQFQNIGEEISSIFEELLVNIAELKDTCILHGAEYDAQSEPLITMTPIAPSPTSLDVVQPLLDLLLDRVFDEVDTKNNENIPEGHFAPAQSFMKEFGEIHDEPAMVNITTAGPTRQNHLILPCLTLERSEGLLNALKDEVREYGPGAGKISENQEKNEENFINLSPQENNPDLIPRNLVDLIKTSDTDTSINNSQSDSIRLTAENLVDSIEQTLERSKKFGPYYEKKPGESLDSTKFPQREIYRNFRSTDVPEMTDSLQHIFFGTENSGEIDQSEFNLIGENTPRPGTSKNLNPSLPHLPSVPSTDLYHSELNSLKNNSNLETLVDNRFSGLTGCSSVQEDIPLDLVTFPPDASGSGISYQQQKENFQLERKSPEINLVHTFGANSLLNKKEIDKSIEDNLRTFQESINKISKTNAKTVEMLSSSAFSTPEGSLSILSTITENLLESSSRGSKTSDERYPQFIARSETNSTTNRPETPNN